MGVRVAIAPPIRRCHLLSRTVRHHRVRRHRESSASMGRMMGVMNDQRKASKGEVPLGSMVEPHWTDWVHERTQNQSRRNCDWSVTQGFESRGIEMVTRRDPAK